MLKKNMLLIRERVHNSIIQNFRVSGRPTKWKGLSHRKGKPLLDTKQLKNSINTKLIRNKIVVNTPLVYAAVHNFGIKKTVEIKKHKRKTKNGMKDVKSHSRKMNIPQREFMLLQKSDVTYIENVIANDIFETLFKGLKL